MKITSRPPKKIKNNIKDSHELFLKKKIKTKLKIAWHVRKKTIKKGWLKKIQKKIFNEDNKKISFISEIVL